MEKRVRERGELKREMNTGQENTLVNEKKKN